MVDYIEGQRTVRHEKRTFAMLPAGRRWTRIAEYISNGQLTMRWFVDEATGEVRESDGWAKPKRWPVASAAAEFIRGLLELPDGPRYDGHYPGGDPGRLTWSGHSGYRSIVRG